MEVIVPLFRDQIPCDIRGLSRIYTQYYGRGGKLVSFRENNDESGFLSAGGFTGRDDMEISVFGNTERITLIARFDNLGQGASGAAIQNMNLVLGVEETTGLILGE
jgi:N-acetyl-gamma-glutamyl-phosphate reductase